MNEAEHRRFVEIWDKGDYRGGSTAFRLVNRILVHIPEGKTINDYGCGTGRAEVEILSRRPEQKINMVDIAPNALEPMCKALLNGKLTFTMADLTDLGDLPWADWGMCVNVLMTMPPETIDAALREIRRTCDNLFAEVYNYDDVRLGANQTKTRMNRFQWTDKLLEYWPEVYFEGVPGAPQRYIFICYGDGKQCQP